MLEHKSTFKTPLKILPGSLGGVLTNMALADGTIYVVTCKVASIYTRLSRVDGTLSKTATGSVEALNFATGKVVWETRVPDLSLGAATVSNDLVFTTLVNGVLIALKRSTGAIVLRRKLPSSTNAPIVIAGSTVLVPAGGLGTDTRRIGKPQLRAYTAP